MLNNDLVNVAVLGESRYGKSYYAKAKFLESKKGGIFFNPRNRDIKNTIRINNKALRSQVFAALRAGDKLNYVLDPNLPQARKDLNKMVELLFGYRWIDGKGLILIFDEVQDFAYQGDIKSGALRCARTGLGENIESYFIAQRPADVSNIILAQCEKKVFFKPSQEDVEWLHNKKYPLADIQGRIAHRKYYFVEYAWGELSQAKTIKYRGEL